MSDNGHTSLEVQNLRSQVAALEELLQAQEQTVFHQSNRLQATIADLRQAKEEADQAKVEADEANLSKSAFLANMSHELRTPLNAIIGYSEMLREDAEDLGLTDVAPDLNKITTAGQHLLSLINDVLDLSKIEAGRMEVHPEQFQVSAFVDEVAATVQPLVQNNGTSLELETVENIGSIFTDKTKLRQSLYNLLSNAAKFTEGGQIWLRSSREILADGAWLVFEVSDTGIGISDDNQTKLFQAFTQVDDSPTRKHEGTGLGLAITQRFCRLLGGDVDLQSELGKGTTVTIRIPAEMKKSSTAPYASEQPGQTEPPPENVDGDVVLVIDDEAAARELMQRYLQREGYAAVTAANGVEGLRLARQLSPIAITLDVMMPGMDGWSLLQALKEDPELAQIPVIMVSMVDDQNKGYALGAVDYLAKPVNRKHLARVLDRFRTRQPSGPILLVGLDATVTATIRHELEAKSLEVIVAGDGGAALERVAQKRPWLILLDLAAAEMDGTGFVDTLRRNPDWNSIPLIIVADDNLRPGDLKRLHGSVEPLFPESQPQDLLAKITEMVEQSR